MITGASTKLTIFLLVNVLCHQGIAADNKDLSHQSNGDSALLEEERELPLETHVRPRHGSKNFDDFALPREQHADVSGDATGTEGDDKDDTIDEPIWKSFQDFETLEVKDIVYGRSFRGVQFNRRRLKKGGAGGGGGGGGGGTAPSTKMKRGGGRRRKPNI